MLLFFIDAAATGISTLSLHDALPISYRLAEGRRGRAALRLQSTLRGPRRGPEGGCHGGYALQAPGHPDRKSTRLNSSHQIRSYAVFCLKKKKNDGNT